MPVVYKIDRVDGLSYIGITTNFKKRLNQHKNSKRFKNIGIVDAVVLYEGEYAECERIEEHMIEVYDTYRNGLNVTPGGKGKNINCKFNTLGFKFSEQSKKIMSEKSKARIRKRGYKHAEETKAAWSLKRRGRFFGNRKINDTALLQQWDRFEPTQQDMDSIPTRVNKRGETVFVNSRIFSIGSAKLLLFCKKYSAENNVTPQAVKRTLKNANKI